MVETIVFSITTLAGLGITFGLLLSYASKVFYVEIDPKLKHLEEALPGLNCGVCGYAGCNDFASAVLRDDAPVDGCKAGGIEIARDVADIMGVELEGEEEALVAVVNCTGRQDGVVERFIYDGIKDCNIANSLAGGSLLCTYGCLGGGDCIKACPFDAITYGKNNSIIIEQDKCVGCGGCVTACSRNIITLIPVEKRLRNLCANKEKGKLVRKSCKVGCIACKACQKACEVEAITIEDFLAVIDYEKCDDCGKCVEKCPTNCLLLV